ncbi:MAG: hypothetical protein JOS17DRAFT_486380 [Linnemannia elongata]|nr:MAG: hypothetical protein JOS17DRAFT_486380 [Linnemannia elongata]
MIILKSRSSPISSLSFTVVQVSLFSLLFYTCGERYICPRKKPFLMQRQLSFLNLSNPARHHACQDQEERTSPFIADTSRDATTSPDFFFVTVESVSTSEQLYFSLANTLLTPPKEFSASYKVRLSGP